jgi:hypothetical protein
MAAKIESYLNICINNGAENINVSQRIENGVMKY